MDLTPGQTKLLAYWGEIQSGVSQRMTTAELWNTVRTAAEREGVSLRGIGAIDLGRLRSVAARQRNTGERLNAAPINATITGDMVAPDISSRDAAAMALAPAWIVRFEHDVIIDGELVTQWRASVFEGSLPPTKGALREAVEADAEAMADDYDVSHAGVGAMQISAV